MENPALDFPSLGTPPALAAALAARGYTTATPVQAAVLGAEARDLTVSAQTGSGKTVAFGLLIGRALLHEDRVVPRARPRALVVTPTRELAVQVQRELAWLLGEAGAKVASFTGGTDLRGDARSLSRGVDVAVGTPGRLVDLIDRKSLALDEVGTLVLDEADEMLDMGFEEDLKKILGAAPPERRTLLFSATLPPPIRALARRYQRDAVAVDVRAAGRGETGAHDDIVYVAHLCKNGERLAALVNVLRIADDQRSLVFCRTRDAVGDLHRELASRGFLAAAISGDRAQAERDRALETMRSGRVRVLVATNVAARGLDLPELGLVVHADLPENVESLTHRSGRTGRAGRKGRAVFLVEAGERRRAERLFQGAKLRIPFSQAPGLDDVARHDEAAIRAELQVALDAPVSPAAERLADAILGGGEVRPLVAALIERALKERPAGERLSPIEVAPARAPTPPKADGDYVLFEVNLGAKDRAVASWILPLVCRSGGITRREVGAIRVARDRTYFEIAARAAAGFAESAAERDPRAPQVRIGPAQGPLPARQFQAHAPHGKKPPPRHKKPAHKGPASKR